MAFRLLVFLKGGKTEIMKNMTCPASYGNVKEK